MKTQIIIHGHFYQPPRENPFTGIVPRQIQNSSFSDWNQVIDDCCYTANTHSRYLDEKGRVRSIRNNYCNISFNFGPTLLNWADTESVKLLPLLRDAVEYNIEKTGHPNAIAQGFSHSILPLDCKKSLKLQIRWGISDYIHRFGIYPEGFWCPECAINSDVIDALCDEGIKYVILSPWQAESYTDENGCTVKLNGSPAPSDRAFLVSGKRNTISVFFYEPALASDVSFGHLLRNADTFYERLRKMRKEAGNPALIQYATDGEIYGHHEPFGDMALAALAVKVENGDEFEFTNYGAFLESHPAKEYATLLPGEENLGTSWSCCHGVGRWLRDCGCSTGAKEGWNQKWRTPLRDAVNLLDAEIYPVFEQEMQKMGKDPEKVLLEYGDVLCGRTARGLFLTQNFGKARKADAARLLTAIEHLLYSHTSCGWFFNDINGIEPRQDIQYGISAIRLISKYTEKDIMSAFLSVLEKAESNEGGTGKDIALQILGAPLDGFSECAAAAYLYSKVPGDSPLYEYGCFRIKRTDGGAFSITDVRSRETREIAVRQDERITLLTLSDRTLGTEKVIKASDLPQKLRDSVTQAMGKSCSALPDEIIGRIPGYLRMTALLGTSSMAKPPISVIMQYLKRYFDCSYAELAEKWYTESTEKAFETIEYALKHSPAYSKKEAELIFSGILRILTERLDADVIDEAFLLLLQSALQRIRATGFQPVLTGLQDSFFPYIENNEKPSELLLQTALKLNFSV